VGKPHHGGKKEDFFIKEKKRTNSKTKKKTLHRTKGRAKSLEEKARKNTSRRRGRPTKPRAYPNSKKKGGGLPANGFEREKKVLQTPATMKIGLGGEGQRLFRRKKGKRVQRPLPMPCGEKRGGGHQKIVHTKALCFFKRRLARTGGKKNNFRLKGKRASPKG